MENVMEFEHIGLITNEKKDREDWVEATRVVGDQSQATPV